MRVMGLVAHPGALSTTNRRFIHCQPTPDPLPTYALSCQPKSYPANRYPILTNDARRSSEESSPMRVMGLVAHPGVVISLVSVSDQIRPGM